MMIYKLLNEYKARKHFKATLGSSSGWKPPKDVIPTRGKVYEFSTDRVLLKSYMDSDEIKAKETYVWQRMTANDVKSIGNNELLVAFEYCDYYELAL